MEPHEKRPSGRQRRGAAVLATLALARLRPVSWLPPRVRLVAWASAAQSAGTPMAASAYDEQRRGAATSTHEPAPDGAGADAPPRPAGPTVLRSGLVLTVIVAFFVLYVFSWNVAVVTGASMPDSVHPIGQLFGVKQGWSMFSPRPSMSSGWFVVPATLADGRQVDLIQPIIRNDPNLSQDVSWEKPRHLAYPYGETERWRKFLFSITDDEGDGRRHQFAAYICRQWNGSHGGPLALNTFQIVYMTERTLPDYQVAEPQRHTLSAYTCDGTQLDDIDDYGVFANASTAQSAGLPAYGAGRLVTLRWLMRRVWR